MKLLTTIERYVSFEGFDFYVLVEEYKTVYHITVKRAGYEFPCLIARRYPKRYHSLKSAIDTSLIDSLLPF